MTKRKYPSAEAKAAAYRARWADPIYRAEMKAKRAKPWTSEHHEKYARWLASAEGQEARRATSRRQCGREKGKTQKASKVPNRVDLAWAAGFIEGEGCFHKAVRGGQVTACQASTEPLERLLAMFGGTIIQEKRIESQPNWKTRFNWRTSGSRARGVALTIYPFMSARRKQQIRRMFGHG